MQDVLGSTAILALPMAPRQHRPGMLRIADQGRIRECAAGKP
jgi:hypothetical protein